MSLRRNFSPKCIRSAMFLFLVAASALGVKAQVVFSPPKNISNSSANTQAQQIAVDANGNINIIWLDDSSGTLAVLFSRSSDAGVTFSTPENISNQTGSSANSPQIALDSGGNIFVIWTNFSSANSSSVLLTRSTDSGATFSAPQPISNTGAYGAGGRLAVDSSGNIDVVWNEGSSVSSSVFFSRSVDGGASFSPAQNLSNGSGGPQIAVDASGNISLTWVGISSGNHEVVFARSTDGGATFSPAYVVESMPIGGNPFAPPNPAPQNLQLAIDGNGGVNLLWADGSWNGDWFDYNVRFSRSADGGLSFSSPKPVAFNAGSSGFPMMAVGPSDGINVVSFENPFFPSSRAGGIMEILARSADGGATFSRAWNSDACGDANGAAAVATEVSGRISVAYGFFGGPGCPGGGLLFTQSADGSNFSTPQNISGNSTSASPVITTDSGGSMYAVWEETLSPQTSRNQDVFFSRSVALASETVSPAQVTGGSSSAGMVTMNGPAPAGGAVVSLSSSDPSVSVPATVTIAEGTTTATFVVTTTPVAAQTNAVISAVFSGVTQTVMMTVEPPVLTSLTLNPSSPMGGSSSTGTVALSGPAPAGGAVVALANSNTSAASVSSTVTVPAGFSNATFTVSTSRVLCPNSATITASFNTVSQTANLTVMPFVNLPPQACSAIRAHGSTTVGKP